MMLPKNTHTKRKHAQKSKDNSRSSVNNNKTTIGTLNKNCLLGLQKPTQKHPYQGVLAKEGSRNIFTNHQKTTQDKTRLTKQTKKETQKNYAKHKIDLKTNKQENHRCLPRPKNSRTGFCRPWTLPRAWWIWCTPRRDLTGCFLLQWLNFKLFFWLFLPLKMTKTKKFKLF